MDAPSRRLIALESTLLDITRRHRRPALFVSWGKDSMVLLWTLHRLGILKQWTLLHGRDPQAPHKLRDVASWVREVGLVVHDIMPAARQIHESEDGHLRVVARYRLDEDFSTCLGWSVDDTGKAEICLRDEWITGLPLAIHAVGCDAYVIGHKSADQEPGLESMDLHADAVQAAPGIMAYFPLRHWTDEDVWHYSDDFDIPRDTARYTQPDNRAVDPDWKQACGRCLLRGNAGADMVPCPRHGWVPPMPQEMIPRTHSLRRDYFGAPPQPVD
jgi:3'-phosphoadenosine 5'-phosphosulfate sulfotransferase (PAPS reductase)/FAD synthetase